MPEFSALLPTPATGVIRHHTLLRMRWLAIFGQLAALAAARYGFGFAFPFVAPLAIIALAVGVNIILTLLPPGDTLWHNKGASIWLAFDVLQLTGLLYFTGGISNPFALLLLAPITVAATALSGTQVVWLTGFTLLCLTGLYVTERCFSPQTLWQMPPVFLEGFYAAILIASLFLVLYVRRVARDSRRLREALNTSVVALAREQKISAFGALAASVAHALGSPLSTIAIITKEIATDLAVVTPPVSLQADLALLQEQVARCRSILTDFSQHNNLIDHSSTILPLRAFLEQVAKPYHRVGIDLRCVVLRAEGDEPLWPLHAAIRHGIGNILHNAFEHARHRITIALSWHTTAAAPYRIDLSIQDDGAGFAPALLPHLGQAYISPKLAGEAAAHMGLGLFIAKTLLERSGGTVSFSNHSYSDGTVLGAAVAITWQSPVV